MDIPEGPLRIEKSDFGARNRTINRSVPLAVRIVILQGVLVVAIAVMLLLFDRAHALAVLVAGVVVVIPGAGFAWRVAATKADVGQELSAARRLLGGGVAKLLMTFGLLAFALVWIRPEPIAFFATMIVLQTPYWLVPLFESPP